MVYRVFLDSNVICSSLFSRNGPPRQVMNLGHLGIIDLLICPLVEEEVRGVLNRKTPHLATGLVQLLGDARVAMAPNPGREGVRQAQVYVVYPPDAAILGAALEAGADYLVTGNLRHLLVGEAERMIEGCLVCTLTRFLAILAGAGEARASNPR